MTRQLFANIHAFDVRTFIWCMNLKKRQLFTQCSRYVSASADGPWYVIISAVLFFWHDELDQRMMQVMALAFAVERSLYYIAKNGFKRNRPQEALGDFRSFIRPADQFSFPSGHTSCAFLFASFMALLFPVLSLLWFGWASAIAASRVFLGVHFPTDTVVGALLGLTVANWAMGFLA